MEPYGSRAYGSGSPCGACKFLRRKCATDCVFAPYFCSEQGPSRFSAIHKVFGASNASKLLQHVPAADRCEAVFTIAYEAQARMRDPVYGCVAHIFALQQQVAYMQAQVMQMRAQLAHRLSETQRPVNDNTSTGEPFYYPTCFPNCTNSESPGSSCDMVDVGDLQALASKMMEN